MKNRDDYHRCPVCKQLFLDDQCDRETYDDGTLGPYICPNGCVKPFDQPPYEPPVNT